jgi:hypothetical protein
MPWKPEDAESRNRKVKGKKAKKRWSDTANAVRRKYLEEGKSEKEADRMAMIIANYNARRKRESRKDSDS